MSLSRIFSGFFILSFNLILKIAAARKNMVTIAYAILMPPTGPKLLTRNMATAGAGVVATLMIRFMIEYPMPRLSGGKESIIIASNAGW